MRNLCLLLVLVGLFLAMAQGQSAPIHKSQPQKTVAHAVWSSNLETNFGISEQGFQEMGLAALTTDQEFNMLTWAYSREQKAKASVQSPSFDCGRPGQKFADAKPEEYDKVRVNVDASGSADEIISGVRERLRAMNGIEVVYNSDEADLTVSLVAIQTKEQRAGYQLGTASAVVVTEPCTWKLGTYTNSYDVLRDQFVQVGSDVS